MKSRLLNISVQPVLFSVQENFTFAGRMLMIFGYLMMIHPWMLSATG